MTTPSTLCHTERSEVSQSTDGWRYDVWDSSSPALPLDGSRRAFTKFFQNDNANTN